MRKCTGSLLLPLLLSGGIKGVSQNYFYNDNYLDPEWLWETGISLGAMNGFTDLGGKKESFRSIIQDGTIASSRLHAAWYTNLLYQYTLGVRLEAGWGSIYANDHLIKSPDQESINRFRRNLSVRTRIKEIQLLGELYPLSLLQGEASVALLYPYLLGGLSLFNFSPEAQLGNQWIPLAPLRTEGQGFIEYPERRVYPLTQIAFPVGLGCRLDLSPRFHLRLEALHRILQTDYLDDVSKNYIDPLLFNKYLDPVQSELARKLYNRHKEIDPLAREEINGMRGNANKKDAYFSLDLKLGWIINRTRR